MAVSFRALRLSMQIILAIAASVAIADDWVIAFPAPAADKDAVEKRYGAVTYVDASASQCPTCGATAQVLREGRKSFLRVQDSVQNIYSQSAAFSLPLDPIWSWNHDLRSATQIRVHIRRVNNYQFSAMGIEGPATPYSSYGLGVEAPLSNSTTGWKWVELPFSDFMANSSVHGNVPLQVPDSLGNRYSVTATGNPDRRIDSTAAINELMRDSGAISWYDGSELAPLFDSDSFNVLKHVRDLKIFVAGGVRKFGFDIDSLVIEGIKPQWGRNRGRTCSGERILVDQFDANRAPGFGNRLGGSWAVTTDTSVSAPLASRGKSDTTSDADAWGPGKGAFMTARLARDSAWTNPDGGWARLSTSLAYGGGTANFSGLKAISFRIQAGQGANTLFDSAKVRGVTLRLHSPDVPDSVGYFLRIPYDSIRPLPGDSGRDICVELDELRQASWYTGKAGIHVIDPSKLSAISWTLALEDQGAVSAAPSSISIREVSLWKPISVGTRGHMALAQVLAVRGGRIEVRAPSGSESFLEIRRMDGSLASRTRIAPVAGIAQVTVPNERGVYAAELRSADGSRSSTSFAIP